MLFFKIKYIKIFLELSPGQELLNAKSYEDGWLNINYDLK
jgi:hypothetical protein